MIELVNLKKEFGENIILDEVNAKFERETSYAIKGFSGAGKSTFINLISGIEKPTSGKVFFEGKNIFELPEKEYSQFLLRDVGLVFQFPYLIPEFNLIENVSIKGLSASMEESEIKSRAIDLLDKVGLKNKATERPQILSGGEKQRVSLLRALFLRPKFLLGDEITAHLDKGTSISILELIDEFRFKYKMGVIMCSHDPVLISRMKNVFEIVDGKLRKE